MPSPSREASTDDVVITLPRRSRSSRYSAHAGVARDPEATEYDAPEPHPLERRRRRPAHPADVAQSALFEAILHAEVDELEDRAATVERRWHRRCERSTDDVVALPHELKELRQRIAEARRLLDALRSRFAAD